MKKDRFDNATPVHTEGELEQKTHTDNYYLLKEFKEKALPVVIKIFYALAVILVVILMGFTMYLFGCPLIKPEVGIRLQQIVHTVIAWGIGVISQYGFSRWKESAK